VNPEVLAKLRKAGCDWLCYGIESGNQEILDIVKKKITLDKIRESVQMAKDAGVNVLASFILGLPGETRETLQQTMDFACELDTYYGFHVLAPFPGTEVREHADEYGLEILTSDWGKYDANRPVSRTESASPADITAALHKYYRGLRIVPDDMEVAEVDRETLEKSQRRSPLAWALVSNDVIESLGGIKPKAGPKEDLADRIAEKIPYSRQQIDENITSWIDQGLLKYETRDGHLVWRWA
jgi:radical SAM superfamily enzyme YgiQ (UPF0313 family)